MSLGVAAPCNRQRHEEPEQQQRRERDDEELQRRQRHADEAARSARGDERADDAKHKHGDCQGCAPHSEATMQRPVPIRHQQRLDREQHEPGGKENAVNEKEGLRSRKMLMLREPKNLRKNVREKPTTTVASRTSPIPE